MQLDYYISEMNYYKTFDKEMYLYYKNKAVACFISKL